MSNTQEIREKAEALIAALGRTKFIYVVQSTKTNGADMVVNAVDIPEVAALTASLRPSREEIADKLMTMEIYDGNLIWINYAIEELRQ